MSDGCLFCKIIPGAIPCHRIAESSTALAFLDINPLSKGHILVIPKQHGARLHDIDEDSAAGCMRLAHRIAIVCFASISEQYNLLQNNGPLAHQEVGHVHFHLIPKRDEQTGLVVGWPTQSISQEDLKLLAADLSAKLDAI